MIEVNSMHLQQTSLHEAVHPVVLLLVPTTVTQITWYAIITYVVLHCL